MLATVLHSILFPNEIRFTKVVRILRTLGPREANRSRLPSLGSAGHWLLVSAWMDGWMDGFIMLHQKMLFA